MLLYHFVIYQPFRFQWC